MGMMNGSGPFGPRPSGYFHPQLGPERPRVFLETTAKRIRVLVGDEVVADSRHARLLLQRGQVPAYYLPRGDVNMQLLREAGEAEEVPLLGPATHYDLEVGGRRIERAARIHGRPPEHLQELADLVAFRWDAADTWLEEDDPIDPHPRDPYHRVDVRQGSQHVRVLAHGEVLAESRRPRLVFETSLPVRFYLPPEDVRMERLEESDRRFACPYKGKGRYWHLKAAGRRVEDGAWSIPEPLLEAVPVEGWLSFVGQKVDLEIEGRPAPWL